MNDETRKLYAAIGRGETVQYRKEQSVGPLDWNNSLGQPLLGQVGYIWSIKPREILVNGVRVPEPLSELPESGLVYTPEPNWDRFYDEADQKSGYARKALARGIAHATKEAAIAHAKAMLIRVPA